jgi:hypothetical protein
VSSLYRCRARVAYKPFNSERLIVFEEKQIQEMSVKLKWNNTFPSMNSQGTNSADAYTSGISQSTCQVTISDPYLTGAAWPALFDAASMWSASNTAQTNNIILPPCGENQDPVRDKCFRYASIDDSALINSDGTSRELSSTFAHIIISLWYEVNGTSFGSDYYFRVNRISVNHGANYPSVTLAGTEPKAVVFNQNLINVKFDEGMSVEEALKKIAEESGYKASFCVPPGEKTTDPYILPRSIIYKGVTPDEAMKKLIGATGGSMLSLPVKEFGNRVSICTRGEITQSCTVFYLGKGLYESYQIDGEPPVTFAARNTQSGASINNGDPYTSASFAAEKYSIKEVIKEKRIKALEQVKKVTFPDLFKSCDKRCQGPLSDGYGWSGAGPSIENKRYIKTNFYGIAPNGTQAISYLPGKVESASEDEGKVVIKTEFWFQVCKEDKSEKCFGRYIYQESTNLSDVKVKRGDEVKISQAIGSSTTDKKELTRFYIQGHSNEFTTIDPQLIWNWASPAETAADFQNKDAPSSTPTGQTPPPSNQSTSGSLLVGRVGSTGSSTGPHLHAEKFPQGQTGGRGQRIVSADVDPYVSIGGTPASTWGVYSPYGPRSGGMHYGIDFSGPGPGGKNINSQPVTVTGGAKILKTGYDGGYGNFVEIRTPAGYDLLLAHLQDQSIPPNLPSLTSSDSAGNTEPTIATAPANKALTIETSFKGVPRALRITPGRTILSFITDYDKWVENGGPRGQDPSTDPGVWLPSRFRNWFVGEVEFVWRQGDLRVNIEANNAWGNSVIFAPTFPDYLQGQQGTGEFEITKDYYGYIRSIGDLCFPIKNKDGKMTNSCKELCKEAQEFYKKYGSGEGSTDTTTSASGDGGAGSQTGFPVAKCQYTGTKYDQAKVNKIINAAYSGGIRTNIGLAGVVANAIWESRLDPKARGDNGDAWGVFQWNSRRPGLIAYAQSVGGDPNNFDVQMGYFVKELKTSESATVPAVNGAGTLAAATEQFERKFERAGIPKIQDRIAIANEIFPSFSCS